MRMTPLSLLAAVSLVVVSVPACKKRKLPSADDAPAPAARAPQGPDPRSPPPTVKVVEGVVPPKSPPTLGTDPLTQAENLILEGKGAAAVLLLEPMVKASPNEGRTWSLLGRAYHLAKRGPDAIDAFARALALEPKDAAAIVGSCLARAERGDAQPGVVACTKALAVDKDNLDVKLSLGVSSMQAGKALDALPLLETVAKLRPQAADVLVPLGRTYLYLRRWPEAKAELTRAIAADPKRVLPKELLARALFELDDAAPATKLWREVLVAEPNNESARRGLTLALRKSQSPAAAAGALGALAKQFPDDVTLARELAGAQVDAKRWDEAAESIEKLVAKNAASTSLVHNLGVAYAELGKHDRAVATLKDIAAAPDARPQTRLLYAAELESAGRHDDAAAVYDALIRSASGTVEAQRAAEGLKRVKSKSRP